MFQSAKQAIRTLLAAAALAGLAAGLGVSAAAQSGPAVPSSTDAPIAFLIDLSSGQVLHARGADRRFIPASITKAMTLYHAFELIEEGALDPSDVYTMTDETWREWNSTGSTMWINAGDRVAVDDLLMGIANISANDASIMLAQGQAGSVAAWVDGMNARARELGLTDTYFGTPNGWPDEGRTFTSARDLARLADAMTRRHPERFARYVGQPGFSYGGITQPNRDPLLSRVEGADGIKTGYTNEAGFSFLGTAQRDGQRLALVIAGSPRSGTRARAARSYMEWGFSAFDRAPLYAAGERVATARVQGGAARDVALMTDREVIISVPEGRQSDVTLTLTYDGPLRAPLRAGDEVATLVVDVPGMEPVLLPLLAAQDVVEAGFLDRIFNAVSRWFS